MNPRRDFWQHRRVLVTGHTGFKGAWLCRWLSALGADVTGYALPPEPSPFDLSEGVAGLQSTLGDVRDRAAVESVVAAARPEVVFHLAAQALVRRSYVDPVGTFETNVIGTAHVLDAVRRAGDVRAVIVVTSDKCYENREWCWPYREDDPLGGFDPYSSSKGAAELVTAAWRRSFFDADHPAVGVASVRAGNVVGGGDWSEDRLVPDCVRAFSSSTPVVIRNPASVRPWQHVLDPLLGYLVLAERLAAEPAAFGEAWNLGPAPDDARPVSWVVDQLTTCWGADARWVAGSGPQPHEAGLLQVDASKARARLGWRPRLPLADGLRWTAEWYRRAHAGDDPAVLTSEQIARYEALEEDGAA